MIQEMLDQSVIVDIHDAAVVKAYVEVYQFLHELPGGARTNIGENDLWIAAVARATKSTLLTMDKHFDPLDPEMISRAWVDTSLPDARAM